MRSLGARMAAATAGVVVVFVLLTAVALERAFRESARYAVQDRLIGQIYLLIAEAELDANGELTMPAQPVEPRLAMPGSGVYAAIRGPDGTALWRSPSALGITLAYPERLPPGKVRFQALRPQSGPSLYMASLHIEWETPDGYLPLTFHAAEDRSHLRALVARFRGTLWMWLGAMALLLIGAQLVALRWGLRPLTRAAREIEEVEAGRRNQLSRDYPTEVRRLTSNLNALLESERARLMRYRHALADLAHSLKTPLAVLQASVRGDDPATMSGVIKEQVERMDALIHHQLQRAAASGRSAMSGPLAVTPVAQRLKTSLDKVYADRSVVCQIQIATDTVFSGDEADLMELLGNLMDNSYKWAHRLIRVTAGNTADGLEIRVEDDGPGIDTQIRSRILARGGRADEYVPGHGIGLAVVSEIVQAYRGSMEIARSRLGGARLTLRLPGR